MKMEARDVLEIVRLLEGGGVTVWLDGGWGVDALLGEQRRPHKDLDLVLSLNDVEAAHRVLQERGFRLVRGAPPAAFVLADGGGREIDVHPVHVTGDGDGIYRMENGEEWVYPAAGFAGEGRVAGEWVRCLTPEVQMLCHTGYALTGKDVQEVLALHERFGVPVPEEYQRGKSGPPGV